jgi:hypothetical protein
VERVTECSGSQTGEEQPNPEGNKSLALRFVSLSRKQFQNVSKRHAVNTGARLLSTKNPHWTF